MKYQFDTKNHLHLLDGKPLTGTSSVGDVLFKPLHWWASGQAVNVLGWLHPKNASAEERKDKAREVLDLIKGMDVESYLELLDKAYRAHADKLQETKEEGTDLHEILERYVKWSMGKKELTLSPDEMKLIEPFVKWAKENVKKFLWSEGHCYDEDLWVGGVSDCGAELKDGSLAVIDFKHAKEAYITSFIQCAGYAIQVEKNGIMSRDGKHQKKFGEITKVIVVPFGANEVKPEVRNAEEYKEGFRHAVALYRLMGLEKQNGK